MFSSTLYMCVCLFLIMENHNIMDRHEKKYIYVKNKTGKNKNIIQLFVFFNFMPIPNDIWKLRQNEL